MSKKKWYDRLADSIADAFKKLISEQTDGGGASPPNAEPPADHPNTPPSSYILQPSPIWTGPDDTYKLVGLLSTARGWFATTSNVYRGENRSKIFLNGKLIFSGSQETIGQPFECGDLVIFPVEHGSNCLIWKGGRISAGAKTGGRWSCLGFVRNGRPLLAYNDEYRNKRMYDYAALCDAVTGEKVAVIEAKTMPRDAAFHDGDWFIPCNFGENIVYTLAGGKKIAGDVIHAASNGSALYGGGGAKWGPSGSRADANGKIYRLKGWKWEEIHDTGSSSIQCMIEHKGDIFVAAVDPDQLLRISPDGKVTLLAEIKGETADNGARSFGGSITVQPDGSLLWGRSDSRRAHVHRLAPGAIEPVKTKTYLGSAKIKGLSGTLRDSAIDADFGVEIAVQGTAAAFAAPAGKTFSVSGKITGAKNDQAAKLLQLAGSNAVGFADEPITGIVPSASGFAAVIEKQKDSVAAKIGLSITPDWSSIGISAEVDVSNPLMGIMADNIILEGTVHEKR